MCQAKIYKAYPTSECINSQNGKPIQPVYVLNKKTIKPIQPVYVLTQNISILSNGCVY